MGGMLLPPQVLPMLALPRAERDLNNLDGVWAEADLVSSTHTRNTLFGGAPLVAASVVGLIGSTLAVDWRLIKLVIVVLLLLLLL